MNHRVALIFIGGAQHGGHYKMDRCGGRLAVCKLVMQNADLNTVEILIISVSIDNMIIITI